jgi:transcriptional regulator with XRE-family HTH domain
MSTKYASFIKTLRLKRGLSQAVLAEKLGLSRQSYMAIERGTREMTLQEAEKLCEFYAIPIAELSNAVAPQYEKYKQMILAFLRAGKKIPKTKLAKLLYFADFAWYYKKLESMSGMRYRKIQYGPVPDSYFRIIDEMSDGGEIDITQTEDGAMLISQTRSGARVDLSEISKEEGKLIKSVEEKWRGKKTAEIVDFTHKQFPYLYAQDNEIVSYALITQEDPHEVY